MRRRGLWNRLAGKHPGQSLVINRNLAIHDDERDADRELAWIVVGRRVDDALGVENDQVSEVAPLDAAAVAWSARRIAAGTACVLPDPPVQRGDDECGIAIRF